MPIYKKEKLINLEPGDLFRFLKRKNINEVVRIYEFNGRSCMAYRSAMRMGYITGDKMNKEVYIIRDNG